MPVIQRFYSLWFNLPVRFKGVAVISIPAACLLGSLLAFNQLQKQVDRAEQWVRHTQEVRLQSSTVLYKLIDAETGIRGYNLTGEPSFLWPYTEALKTLPDALNALEQLVRDNSAQQSKLREIKRLAADRLASLRRNLALTSVADARRDRSGLLLRNLREGQAKMDVLRAKLDEFTDTEERLLKERKATVQRQRENLTEFLWLTGLIGVGGGLAASYLYSLGIVRRMAQLQGNAQQLALGRPLCGLVPGQDEISQLCRFLHIAAEQIAEREAQLRETNYLLAKATQREKALIENSLEVICSIDTAGQFVDVSPACFKLWGYTADELAGQRYMDLVAPEDRDRTEAVAAAIVSGQPASNFENRYLRKDGSLVDMTWSALWSEAEQLMFCVARDNTERKEVERLKNEFISTVSHELRTPLTSLRGFSEMLLMKKHSPEKQQEYLLVIRNESQRLTNLLNDFLDIQRIESGRQGYVFEAIDVLPLLHESAFLFARNSALHTLRVEAPEALPTVKADSDRVRQVLSNLLSNAIKYSPQGGEVTLAAQDQGTTLRLSVSDQGIGMAAEAMKKLFTKFYRVDNADTRSIGGTGLGLALTKAIIEDHSGQIEVESEVGKGSTFSFTLPKAVLIPVVASADQRSQAVIDVLVLEDNDAYTQLLREQLEPLNLNVVSTAFAEQALQLIEQHCLPRSIILDIHLAGEMDGWDFLISLRSRSNPRVRALPVFVITVSEEPNLRGLALRGADYLPKPVEPEVLIQTVQYHLPNLTDKTVMVVDDDAVFRHQVMATLGSQASVRFVEAENGVQALTQIQERIPDFLILDLMMPELDGFEVLRQLRASKDALNLPVLIVTGIDLSPEEKDYLKKRMAILIDKRAAATESLIQTVKQALEV